MARVLVVEDDAGIRTSLVDALALHGHTARGVGGAFPALHEVAGGRLDLVVLDLGLPDLDGGDALRMIRGISQVPVIVATARDGDDEMIELLNAGADDYLVKPFSGGQLAARVAAVLRRSAAGAGPHAEQSGTPAETEPKTSGLLTVGDLQVDPVGRTAYLAGAELPLTRREFDLLAYLAAHAGQVVPKRTILAEVWRESYIDDQTIDVHLSSLRRKMGEPAARPRYLRTVRGVGIKLVTPR
jgi:DNA-binding response OmpR family regulator